MLKEIMEIEKALYKAALNRERRKEINDEDEWEREYRRRQGVHAQDCVQRDRQTGKECTPSRSDVSG